jgi:hypothetical protein
MNRITLGKGTDNEATCERTDFVITKHRSLKKWGYNSLTRDEVDRQLTKVLAGDKDISIIGQFIKTNIDKGTEDGKI